MTKLAFGLKKPARTPGFVAGFAGWLAFGVAIAVPRNARSSQGVLPMFIGFGHACVSDGAGRTYEQTPVRTSGFRGCAAFRSHNRPTARENPYRTMSASAMRHRDLHGPKSN